MLGIQIDWSIKPCGLYSSIFTSFQTRLSGELRTRLGCNPYSKRLSSEGSEFGGQLSLAAVIFGIELFIIIKINVYRINVYEKASDLILKTKALPDSSLYIEKHIFRVELPSCFVFYSEIFNSLLNVKLNV